MSTSPDAPLSSRWTDEQKERAHSIVNDIAEDIDNKETRQQLREALAIYADLLHDKHHARRESHMQALFADLERLERLMRPEKETKPLNREHEAQKRIGMETMFRASKLEQAAIIARHYVRFASYMLAMERMIQTHAQTPQPFKAAPGSLLSENIEAICDRAFTDLAQDYRLTFGIDLPHYQFPTDSQPTPAQPVPPTHPPSGTSPADKLTFYGHP